MSIATEIERIQTAKEDIKQALIAKSITNNKQISGASLDDYGWIIGNASIVPKPPYANIITLNNYGRLTKIEVSTNSIGQNYRGARYLTQFKWIDPTRVTSLSNYAFEGCSSLPSLTIPSGITAIPNYCFAGCSALTGVTNPNATVAWTSIGNGAFSGCTNLTAVAGVGTATTSIGERAFMDCRALTSINIPNVTSIAYGTFEFCSNLTGVTITNATSIEAEAFILCSGLTSVSIPNVTFIGNNAFESCSGLTSIVIPDSCTMISSQAFAFSSALETVDVGTGMTYLTDYGVFQNVGTNTANGATFIFRANQKITISYNTFNGASVKEIYVPDALVSSYQADNMWLQVVGSDTTKIKPLSDYVTA